MDQTGSGPGAILHADFRLVNAANPATAGETVLLYLTGMGTVNPPVTDGTAGSGSTLSQSTSQVVALVAGQPGTIAYNGLAPGFPGLYQINVTLPAFLPASGNLPLAIQTANAFHDQVDIAIR
jgi:minor extracellular serine protease Vpr